MFKFKPDKQLRATLAIVSSMGGLWLLGVTALALIPTDEGSQGEDRSISYRYQAAGVTYAYQDPTGQYTVYVRGTQRIATP